MTLLDAVAVVGLALSLASFGVFVALAFGWGLSATTASARAAATRAAEASKSLTSVTGEELASILKAISSLGESLVKAGPSFAALIASILFLTVSMIASGGIRSDPPVAKSTTQIPTRTPGTTTGGGGAGPGTPAGTSGAAGPGTPNPPGAPGVPETPQ